MIVLEFRLRAEINSKSKASGHPDPEPIGRDLSYCAFARGLARRAGRNTLVYFAQ